jgi:hypothetical protein
LSDENKGGMGAACSTHEIREAYTILVSKHGRKRTPGRSKLRWDNGILTILKKQSVKVWTGFNWVIAGTSCGFL